MNQSVKTSLGIAIVLVLAITATVFVLEIDGYRKDKQENKVQYPTLSAGSAEKIQSTEGIQMANPASVYCGQHGGSLEIRTGQNGGQAGYCILADGKECEEWAFMRGECPTNRDSADNWKKYRNEEYGFEFAYPPDIEYIGGSVADEIDEQAPREVSLGVFVYDLNDMEDGPFGFTSGDMLKDIDHIKLGDASVRIGCSIPGESKILNIKGGLGKKSINLTSCIDSCSLEIKRYALIYRDNVAINLAWSYNDYGRLIDKNKKYFRDDVDCQDFKDHRLAASFLNDFKSGKTDETSQRWFRDFDRIIGTFEFIKPNAASD